MSGVSRRMLQIGELPRDLLKRQDAPQVAALAVPPLRVFLRRCGMGMVTDATVTLSPRLHAVVRV